MGYDNVSELPVATSGQIGSTNMAWKLPYRFIVDREPREIDGLIEIEYVLQLERGTVALK